MSLPQEVVQQLRSALDAAAPAPNAAERDEALAAITRLAGGKVDPASLERAYRLFGHDPEGGSGTPHVGAA